MVTTSSLGHHAACCVWLFTCEVHPSFCEQAFAGPAMYGACHTLEGCHSLQVPEEERQARRDELVALQQEVGERFAEGMVGQEVGSCHADRLLLFLQKPEIRDRHPSTAPSSKLWAHGRTPTPAQLLCTTCRWMFWLIASMTTGN